MKEKKEKSRVTYRELLEAWWMIHRAHPSGATESVRLYLTYRAFDELLRQSDWTRVEWTAANEAHRSAKARRGSK